LVAEEHYYSVSFTWRHTFKRIVKTDAVELKKQQMKSKS
jgi:hypothetical protein